MNSIVSIQAQSIQVPCPLHEFSAQHWYTIRTFYSIRNFRLHHRLKSFSLECVSILFFIFATKSSTSSSLSTTTATTATTFPCIQFIKMILLLWLFIHSNHTIGLIICSHLARSLSFNRTHSFSFVRWVALFLCQLNLKMHKLFITTF